MFYASRLFPWTPSLNLQEKWRDYFPFLFEIRGWVEANRDKSNEPFQPGPPPEPHKPSPTPKNPPTPPGTKPQKQKCIEPSPTKGCKDETPAQAARKERRRIKQKEKRRKSRQEKALKKEEERKEETAKEAERKRARAHNRANSSRIGCHKRIDMKNMTFNIVPLPKMGPRFIQLDTKGLVVSLL